MTARFQQPAMGNLLAFVPAAPSRLVQLRADAPHLRDWLVAHAQADAARAQPAIGTLAT